MKLTVMVVVVAGHPARQGVTLTPLVARINTMRVPYNTKTQILGFNISLMSTESDVKRKVARVRRKEVRIYYYFYSRAFYIKISKAAYH